MNKLCFRRALIASVFSSALAVMQTEVLHVELSDSPPSMNSYSMFASQAFFGKLPSMKTSENPVLKVITPPEDNPLLCQNVTSEVSSDGSARKGTMMLVPRGKCSFESKAYRAQQLGSEGILVHGNLASRYDLNTTNKTADYSYSENDIIFPHEHYDYDCSKGRALIKKSSLSFEPLPYKKDHNDPLLSGPASTNLCMTNSPDDLRNCPSKACLLTGNTVTQDEEIMMESCCAWDLFIWLYQDDTMDVDAASNVNIPAAYITMEQAAQLSKDMQSNSEVNLVLSSRWRTAYQPSMILIWLLGVFVAGLAAYLSAGDYHDRVRKLLHRQNQRSGGISRPQPGGNRQQTNISPPPDDMELTAMHALVFIIMASSSLLILFYFKIYGIVKVFYAMGCSKAVSQVIVDPLIKRVMRATGRRNQIVWRTGTEDFGDITTRDIVAHVIGYSLGLSWLVLAFTVREHSSLTYFWLMQDIFGSCMCIMFLQVIKLNSIRVASILLIVAFFYDIFFVFVTPLLFKGKSVMLTVATSGGPPTADALWCEKYPDDKDCQGGDPLPMLLTIPRLFDYQGGSSLLGLGDIVLPGLLLSMAARFDAAKRMMGIVGGGSGNLVCHGCPERRYCFGCSLCSGGYFPPMVVAYACGLLMANVAVQLMRMGQPALLYLVPCCLGTMCFLGWRRNELGELWGEPKVIRAADNIIYGEYYSGGPTNPTHMPLAQEEEGETPGISGTQVPSAVDEATEVATDARNKS